MQALISEEWVFTILYVTAQFNRYLMHLFGKWENYGPDHVQVNCRLEVGYFLGWFFIYYVSTNHKMLSTH